MMQKSLLYFLLLFIFSSSFAQKDTTVQYKGTHTVYAELFGNGYLYSVNYDYIFFEDRQIKSAARIGVSALPIPMLTGVGIPLEVSILYGKNSHFLEGALGATYFNMKSRIRQTSESGVVTYTTDKYQVLDITLRIGYRYQKPGKGLFFRAGFTPVFAVLAPSGIRDSDVFPFARKFTPWGGISLGYSFQCKKKL